MYHFNFFTGIQGSILTFWGSVEIFFDFKGSTEKKRLRTTAVSELSKKILICVTKAFEGFQRSGSRSRSWWAIFPITGIIVLSLVVGFQDSRGKSILRLGMWRGFDMSRVEIGKRWMSEFGLLLLLLLWRQLAFRTFCVFGAELYKFFLSVRMVWNCENKFWKCYLIFKIPKLKANFGN